MESLSSRRCASVLGRQLGLHAVAPAVEVPQVGVFAGLRHGGTGTPLPLPEVATWALARAERARCSGEDVGAVGVLADLPP